jgi:hypothetical protein
VPFGGIEAAAVAYAVVVEVVRVTHLFVGHCSLLLRIEGNKKEGG